MGERPRKVVGLSRVTRIAAGSNQVYAVRKDGTLWWWGSQDGDGDPEESCAKPAPVPGLSNVVAVAVDSALCLVKRNGKVACSSSPYEKESYRDVKVNAAVAISVAGSHRCALLRSGRVACWGAGPPDPVFSTIAASDKGEAAVVEVKGLTGVVAISSGSTGVVDVHNGSGGHVCALKRNGTVWCWGYNNRGQLGLGTVSGNCAKIPKNYTSVSCQAAPVQVPGLTGVQAIAAGGEYTCALKIDGSVWCWGSNPDGRLGDGTLTNRLSPVRVKGLPDVRAIAASPSRCHRYTGCEAHTCALDRRGQAWCWGYNGDDGRLGQGRAGFRAKPARVSGLVGVSAVSAANGHTCALKTDGAVWCWGAHAPDNTTAAASPQALRRLKSLPWIRQVTVGMYMGCAVTRKGRVWCWGAGPLGNGKRSVVAHAPILVPQPTGVVQVSLTKYGFGQTTVCAVTRSGDIWCWGDNSSGQIGNGKKAQHLNTALYPQRISGMPVAQAVAVSSNHVCALSRKQRVWCWGDGWARRPTRIQNLPRMRTLNSGRLTSCGITTSGNALCWESTSGSVGRVRVSFDSKVKATSLAFALDTPCWVGNGRVFCNSMDGFKPIHGLTNVRSISTGQTRFKQTKAHTCAVKNDGTLWCWGHNEEGQLGDGRLSRQHTPLMVAPLQASGAGK